MKTFTASVQVRGPAGQVEVEALVDTGATHTLLCVLVPLLWCDVVHILTVSRGNQD